MEYKQFLFNKISLAEESGFEISPDEVNPIAKPHQRDSIIWAIKGGRRALFESFGLGKSLQQLEWCRLIVKHKGGKALIILPLGVKQEFIWDAVKLLGMDPPEYVRNMDEVRAAKTDIMLTNYERVRDGDIDPTYFTATSLDEASVLRSDSSKTYHTFMKKFAGVPYKLVNTATPSPNDYIELIRYSAFLEIMDVSQAKTRFFQRDSTKADELTLYPHMENDFYLWISSWALFITKPSDLGYDDAGYVLPPLKINYHEVDTDDLPLGVDQYGQLELVRSYAVSLKDAAREKRESIDLRVAKMVEIVNNSPDDHFILWHDLEAERHAIKKALPDVVDIYGSQDYDIREQRVIDFSEGKVQRFATKKEISGQGCNFQRHCHRAIFLGIDYKFNDFIQAIHRIYRFLQTEQVIIDIIYTKREQHILKVLMEKWQQHEQLCAKMVGIVKKHGLSSTSTSNKMARSIGVERVKIESKNYTWVNNDCVLETEHMPNSSIDMIFTSIPFGTQYEYSNSYNDFGYNKDNPLFFEQMDYLTPNLLRILKPGRIFCCHVKDRVSFGNYNGTGTSTVEPFHAYCIQHCIKHGFLFMGMVTIVTDVVRENAQTYRLGWSEKCKDGTKMGFGLSEYILMFRKIPTDTGNSYADEPVVRNKEEYSRAQWQLDAHGFWRSSGNRLISKDEVFAIPSENLQAAYRKFSRNTVYDYRQHVELCKKLDEQDRLPSSYMVVPPASWEMSVWDDIVRIRTLNTAQSQKRRQMHVCPLQLDVTERLINLFSSKGDTVFDPFAGLGTVPLVAVRNGRYGYGIELNTDYFRDGLGYLKLTEERRAEPTLFDFLDMEAG